MLRGWRAWLLAGVTIAAALAAVLLPAMPQPLSYHDFADSREWFAVPNFLNVASNLPFLTAGLSGLVALAREEQLVFRDQAEKLPYIIFFAGAALTCLGSAYYHAAPDNARLVWDRLPMTLAFAGLVAAVVSERIDERLGARSLWPLVALGAATVMYWHATERAGSGNVLPYGIYQGWTIIVLLLIVASVAARRYSHGHLLWWPVVLYALAKITEAYDLQIYRAGQIVSGHTLKHLLAAAAVYAVLAMLRRRTILEADFSYNPRR